mmetsp:Transcript_50506/g.114702  ORF Transcript_50506/g.114702 Transcript_50506/m.114702 type:complete len:258 (+) Transcript_50506:64-837(+)
MSAHAAASTLRKQLLDLDRERGAVEEEMQAIIEELTSPPLDGKFSQPAGLTEPLVAPDGFPRADVDVYNARHKRHRLSCLRTDHKGLMTAIEAALHELHAAQASETPPSQPARAAPEEAENGANGGANGTAHLAPFCLANDVLPGSPAYLGGLRSGDRIQRFGNVDATNHRNLQGLADVVRHSIGRPISVETQRHGPASASTSASTWASNATGALRLVLEVTPGAWEGRGVLGCHFLPLLSGPPGPPPEEGGTARAQ